MTQPVRLRRSLDGYRVIAILACGLSNGPIAGPATAAELRIFSPAVPEPGAVEFEANSSVTFDKSRERDGQQSHFGEVGYGVTDFWRTEIEGNWESGKDGLRFRTLDNENIFQLSSQSRSWIDFGLLQEWD
jgi:hypothetical protein